MLVDHSVCFVHRHNFYIVDTLRNINKGRKYETRMSKEIYSEYTEMGLRFSENYLKDILQMGFAVLLFHKCRGQESTEHLNELVT